MPETPVFQISLMLLAALLTVLAVFVWRAQPERSSNRWFAAFMVFVGLWTIAVSGIYSGHHHLFWSRFTFCSSSFIPIAFLAFIYNYPLSANRSSASSR